MLKGRNEKKYQLKQKKITWVNLEKPTKTAI